MSYQKKLQHIVDTTDPDACERILEPDCCPNTMVQFHRIMMYCRNLARKMGESAQLETMPRHIQCKTQCEIDVLLQDYSLVREALMERLGDKAHLVFKKKKKKKKKESMED